MKSARLKLFFLSLLLGAILLTPSAFAVEEKFSTEQMRSDLSDIKTRLNALEKGQKEIIAKEEKILEEVDRVRIWVHKR